MRERMRDNVGDAVARRIAASGFHVEATRTLSLRIGGTVAVHRCTPEE
jgi:hypothetical protein